MTHFKNTVDDQTISDHELKQIHEDYDNLKYKKMNKNYSRCTDPNHICHNVNPDAEYKFQDLKHQCNKDCDIINPQNFEKVNNILLELYENIKDYDINKNIAGYDIEHCFKLSFDKLILLKEQVILLKKNQDQKRYKTLSQKLKKIKLITKTYYTSQVIENPLEHVLEHKKYRSLLKLEEENEYLKEILNVTIKNRMKLDHEKDKHLFRIYNLKITRIEIKMKHNNVIIKYCDFLKKILIFEIFALNTMNY